MNLNDAAEVEELQKFNRSVLLFVVIFGNYQRFIFSTSPVSKLNRDADRGIGLHTDQEENEESDGVGIDLSGWIRNEYHS